MQIGDRRFWWDGFLSETKVFALVMLGFIVLGAVSYYLYALIQGGRYCVLFEMDEQGVKHTQLARPFRKSQVVAALLKAVGRDDRELTLAQIVALGRTLADNPVHAAAIAANPPPSDLSAARLEIDPKTGDVRAWYAIPADTNGAKGLSEVKVAFDLCR